MTNEELVKLLQELSDGMICGKHVIELGQAADRIEALTAEGARLRHCLKNANDKHEFYEREWYLRGDRIETLTAALEKFDDLIQYQYTGSREAMSAMVEAAQEGARVLGRGAWKEAGHPWLWTYDPHLKEKQL